MKKVKFRLTADAGAKPGFCSIDFKHSYRDKNSTNRETTDTMYVKISGPSAESPNVVLSGIYAGSIVPGNNFTVTAQLDNFGAGAASEVYISVEDLNVKSNDVYLINGANNLYFPELEGKYSGKVNISFGSVARADGDYPCVISLSYRGQGEEKPVEKKYPYSVLIKDPAEDSGDRAMIEIRGMSSPSGTVNVDQNATVTFEVFNAGAAAAENVKVSAFGYAENEIVPKSANIRQIAGIPAGAGEQLSFTFAPTAFSKSQSYTVGIKVE
jgi:hypothetical protein